MYLRLVMIKYFVMRNFKGTCTSVKMLKGYMFKERLGTPDLKQCGPTTGPRAAYGPPQCFQWPSEAFRKNLQIWYLLKSVWGHIWIKCIFTNAIPFLCTILLYKFILWSNQKVYGPPLIPWLDNLCFLGVPCLAYMWPNELSTAK